MKKLLFLFLLTSSMNDCMFSAFRGIAKNKMPIGQKMCFNTTHPRFGETHFIVGCDNKKAKEKKERVSAAPSAIKKPKVKIGDAAAMLDEKEMVQAFFTSHHDIQAIIAKVLDQSKKTIRVAAYALTDPTIAQQLKKAHKAGIVVEIATDAGNMRDQYSKINGLVNDGISVCYYDPVLAINPRQKQARYTPLMHHKFIIVDEKTLITGSANYTNAGQKTNMENIVVIRDLQAIRKFIKEFNRLKTQCIVCTPSVMQVKK